MKAHPFRLAPLAALLACSGMLAACAPDAPAPTQDPQADAQPAGEGFVARTARRAMQTAERELLDGNVSVGGANGGIHLNGMVIGGEAHVGRDLPKAEITPAGDLLIAGEAVEIDAEQRQRLLEHRAHIVAIAQAGVALGVQGAQLGVEAAGGAISSLLTGKGEAFEARMQAEAARIDDQALQLCDLLPPLLASQQALAAALPAFAPYATMDSSSIDRCRARDGRQSGSYEAGRRTGQALARLRDRLGGNASDAAAEADAAAAPDAP